MLSSLIVVIVLMLLLRFYVKRWRIFMFARDLSGPAHVPILGNVLLLYNRSIMQLIKDFKDNYKLPGSMWVGSDFYYIPTDPEEIKIILNHPNTLHKFKIFNMLREGIGNCLLVAPVDIWKKNRKIVAKSFNQSILDSFVETFDQKSKTLTEILSQEQDDLFETFSRFTLDSFCETALGIDLDVQKSINSEIINSMMMLQKKFVERVINPLLYLDFIYYNLPSGKQFRKSTEIVGDFVTEIIEKRRKEHKLHLDDHREEVLFKRALIDLLLDLEGEDKLVDQQIKDELLLFVQAATDTTAYSLAFYFNLLGMHPDIQKKVREEILEVVGQDRSIQAKDLPNLKYTERTILESLRLFPVAPVIGRLAIGDVDLGRRILPQGSNVLISAYVVHYDERLWPEPKKFSPDRFAPEEVSKRHAYSYLPFSGGPRNCIGGKYGIMVMKTAIANVLRQYNISSGYSSLDEIELTSDILMRAVGNLNCTFEKIK